MRSKLRALTTALLLFVPSAALAAGDIVMHRDPGCGCCSKWAEQVQQQLGRRVRVVDDRQRAAVQTQHGISAALASCHTAVVDGLAFEGHVPIADMKRLLAQRPKGVRGLAVPGMPLGSPGMEVPGVTPQPYDVIAFGAAGPKVFARHN